MTEAEKEAKRKLKEKLDKQIAKEKAAGTYGQGADADEKEIRDKANAEAKRTGELSKTEEGREKLEQEEFAKEAKREKIIETTEEGLRDPTGANRAAKKEMERQANLPEVKAANAIKDVGKEGVKELLKMVPGVSSEQAGKLTDGLEHVLTKGNLDHPGVGVAKDIAFEQAKKMGKQMFDQGVENRRKLMGEKPAGPVVGSPAMPAEVNVRIVGPVPGAAAPAAAAAGEVIAQKVLQQQQAAPASLPSQSVPEVFQDPQPLQGGAKRKRPRRELDGTSNNTNSVTGYVTKHLTGPKNPKLRIDPHYFHGTSDGCMNNANSVVGYVTKHLAGSKNPNLGIDPSYFC